MNNNTAKLIKIGKAAFGDNWQSQTARAIGVDPRRTQQWVREDRIVPDSVLSELLRILRKRSSEIADCISDIKHGELLKAQSVNTARLTDALRIEFHDYPADDQQDLSDAVDAWIQLKVEQPLAAAAGLDAAKDDVYGYIDNVDDLRDCQNDFIASRFQ